MLVIQETPLEKRRGYLIAKRIFDAASAGVALILFAPVMLLVALLVKLSSPGPVLFSQERIGKDGVSFRIYKFRTMVTGAAGSLITEKKDPRITRIGGLLRKTKLDELPQLFNVVRGDMSVVGPRPETPEFVDYYTEDDRRILKLRPGLTDIATVSFRNEEELLASAEDHERFYINTVLRRKMRFKKEYLRRASFWFDLELILLTVFKILLPGLVIFDEVELDRRVQYLLDMVVIGLMFLLAYIIRYEGIPEGIQFKKMILLTPYVILLRWGVMFLSGVYAIPWRSIRIDHIPLFIFTTLSVSSVFLLGRLLLPDTLHYGQVPYAVIAIEALLNFFGVVGLRLLRRVVFEQRESSRRTDPIVLPRTLIVGAGRMGHLLVKEAINRKSPPFRLIGMLDDDPAKKGQEILGYRVLGGVDELAFHVQRLHAEQVIVAVTAITRAEIRRLLRLARHSSARLKIVPPRFRELDGQLDLSQIWKIRVEDLLGRRTHAPDYEARLDATIRPAVEGKRVLVTGAGGSIGSELVAQLVRLKPESVMLIDKDENSLYKVGLDLDWIAPTLKRKLVIADIRSESRMRECFKAFRPNVVLHAAAYKHVPLMESNAVQAVENNVFGTLTVVELAESYEVERFVMLSTDKAYQPVNVMGATKRLAELIVLGRSAPGPTRYGCVRFGNVIGTRGSVVPTFLYQIEHGIPLTVTSREATRYFMTVQEASRLVLVAAGLMQGHDTFILDMGEPIPIAELAEDLVYLSGHTRQSATITETGLRSGERLHEPSLTKENGVSKTEIDKILIAPSRPIDTMAIRRSLDELRDLIRSGSGRQIKEFLAHMPLGYRPADLESDTDCLPTASEEVG